MFMDARTGKASTTLVQTLFRALATRQRSEAPLAVFDCDGTVLQGKVEAFRQHVVRPPDIVVSDSLYDLPLFEYSAGLKVLVNSNGRPSTDFFSSGHVSRDESWVVVESPTLRS